MMLKRILLVGMFFMLAGYFAEDVKAAEMKIGVMNVQKIIVQCEAGKAGKARFEDKNEGTAGQVQTRRDGLGYP